MEKTENIKNKTDNKKNKKPFYKKDVNKSKIHALEEKNKELENQILSLKSENLSLSLQIKKQETEFKEVAKTFSTKAQDEIKKHIKQADEKLENSIAEIKKYGNQKFFEFFINYLNNLDLAIKSGLNSTNSDVQNYVKGFAMLNSQFEELVKDFGLNKIIPELGNEYDPELHQVFELQDSSEDNKNKILQIKSNGYKLYDRVIKPAVVIVGK